MKQIKKIIIDLSLWVGAALYLAPTAWGAAPIEIKPGGPFGGIEDIEIATVVSTVITILFIVAFVLAFGFLVFGGIKWVMSGGEEVKVKEAQGTLTAAVVGLVIVLLSFVIIKVVEALFGITLIGAGFEIPSFR